MSSNKSISKSNNITIPFLELYNAMERGENWYDILYPANQDVTVNSSDCTETGKKRKRPTDLNGISRDIKKARYN